MITKNDIIVMGSEVESSFPPEIVSRSFASKLVDTMLGIIIPDEK